MSRIIDYIFAILTNVTLHLLYGTGVGSFLFLILLLFGLDGRALGWKQSFLLFALCISCASLFRHHAISDAMFLKKFQQLRNYKNGYDIKPYQYTQLSWDLLNAYLHLNIGLAPARPKAGGRSPEETGQLGSVLVVYLMDAVGAGFCSFIVLFLIFVMARLTPDDVPVAKELLVFCLCVIWGAVFAYIGFSEKSFDKKMKFIKNLHDKEYISRLQFETARQAVMGWYSTGQYGTRGSSGTAPKSAADDGQSPDGEDDGHPSEDEGTSVDDVISGP